MRDVSRRVAAPSTGVTVVTLSPVELRELIFSAIAEYHEGAEAPAEWLTARQACERYRISSHTLRKWRRAGMPCSSRGESPRYPVRLCDAWVLGGAGDE